MDVDDSELPKHSRIMLCAIRRALKTPAYIHSGDEHRAWRILLAASEALHSAGVSGFVGAGTLREIRRICRRNKDIRRQYNGRNLHELADQYGLCDRQIRRIVCNPIAGTQRKKTVASG